MVEMRETATILRDATSRSLVIVDEIGRGTSTFDGLALAWSIAEHLHDAVGCRTMFATHYHQLTELADYRPGVINYSVSAREHDGTIVFLHRLTEGSVSKSYGIAVARLAATGEHPRSAGAILSSLKRAFKLPKAPSTPATAPSRSLICLNDRRVKMPIKPSCRRFGTPTRTG